MKEEIKSRWIKLLESGEYTFGRNFLYNVENDCHCTLGVLVEMAIEDGVYSPETKSKTLNSQDDGKYLSNLNPHTLTAEIQEWAGIEDPYLLTRLTLINDQFKTNDYTPTINYIKENL